MKNFTIGFIVAILLFASTTVFAGDALEKVTAYLNNEVSLTLNGESVELKDEVITYNNSTFLPLREVATLLNVTVAYNNSTKVIDLKSKKENFTNLQNEKIDANDYNLERIIKNGQDVPDLQYGNTVYTPLASWAEENFASKNNINFDGESRKITVKYTDIVIDILDNFEPNSEAFVLHGRTYVRADITSLSYPEKEIEGTVLVEIEGKKYITDAYPFVFENSLNQNYVPLDFAGELLAIAYKNEFSVRDDNNPYTDGVIKMRLDNYIELEVKYLNIDERYQEINIYNQDKSKSYFITNKPGEELKYFEVAGRLLVNLDELFGEFGLEYNIEIDNEDNTIVFNVTQQ